MFLKKHKGIPDNARKVVTGYANHFFLKYTCYILPDCDIDERNHRYLYRLIITYRATFPVKVILAILLIQLLILYFFVQLIFNIQDVFNWESYRDIETIDDLIDGIFGTGIAHGRDYTTLIMSPIEVPERKYKTYYKNAVKILCGKNRKELINDTPLGITILAMEKSGIKLNEYWLDKKEFVRKQANN